MIEAGLEVISPGANVPFADKEIFFGPIMEFTDKKVSLLPDFISNCGIARVFAYLMESKVKLPMKDASIFDDTSNTIKKALINTHNRNNSKQNISKTAFEIALKQLI
jgi:glutamate dehydrogenase/leucine dehydrogenase